MNNTLLSIVIVTNNRKEDLTNLLNSILRQKNIDKNLFEIIVVNNGEDIIDLIKKYEKRLNIKYIKNNENVGASKGRNIGVKNSNGKYILFLDDDNYLQDENILKNIIEKDIKLLEKDDKIGAIRYAVYYPVWKDGKIIKYEYTLPELDVYPLLKDKYRNKLEDIMLKNDIYLLLNHFATCGVLIKKEIFEKVNCFDENMFVYVEDIDLAYSIVKRGYIILQNTFLPIKHIETPKNRNWLWREYHYTKNQFIFLYKHFPLPLMLLYMIHYLTQSLIFYKNIKDKDKSINFINFYIQIVKGIKDFLKLVIKGRVKRRPMSFKVWKYIRFEIPKENIKILKKKGLL